MEPAKQITKARVGMQIHHPFFGYLAISLEPVEKETLQPPTMATNGTKLYYHPEFVKNTSLPELSGVIAHEITHIILRHIQRRQSREPVRWNIAADFAVNELVLNDGFRLPQGALRDQAYDGMSVEAIYNALPAQGGESTLDSHEEWGEWQEGDGDGGQGGAGGQKAGLEQQWQERVAQAVTQARMRGKVTSQIQELVDGILQPKLDWKTLLRDMVTSCAKSDYCMFPPNKKHLHRGIYLPGMTGTEIRIAVVIDSSGSITTEMARDFISEIHGICDAYDDYTVWLYVCDTEIKQRFELNLGDPIPNLIVGRGGTDFREPFLEAAKEPITSLVYFTDLLGRFPDREPDFPVVWVATSDVEAPWGFVIRYPKKNGGRK